MKKRNITLVFLVLLILLYTGCYNISKETEVKHQTADGNEKSHMEEYTKEIEETVSIIGTDDESQYKLIEKEKDKYKDIILEYSQVSTDVWYAVDDFESEWTIGINTRN